MAPAGTPPAVIARLNAEINQALAEPALPSNHHGPPCDRRSGSLPRPQNRLRSGHAADHVADDDDRGAGELLTRYGGVEFAQGGHRVALVGQAGALDHRHGRGGRQAGERLLRYHSLFLQSLISIVNFDVNFVPYQRGMSLKRDA